jgi:WD40 repeat protein
MWGRQQHADPLRCRGRRSTGDRAGPVQAVAWSPDSKSIATGSLHEGVRLWRMTKGSPLKIRVNDFGFLENLAFSHDGKQLVTSGNGDRSLRFWNVETGTLLMTLDHGAWVRSFALSERSVIATVSGDKTVNIWDSAGSSPRHVMEVPDYAYEVAITRDGSRVAAVCKSGTVLMWDAESGELVAPMRHEASSEALAFSVDGRYLATASADRTARVWDAATGREIIRMKHDHGVYAVQFSPNGKHLLGRFLLRWQKPGIRRKETEPPASAASDAFRSWECG